MARRRFLVFNFFQDSRTGHFHKESNSEPKTLQSTYTEVNVSYGNKLMTVYVLPRWFYVVSV